MIQNLYLIRKHSEGYRCELGIAILAGVSHEYPYSPFINKLVYICIGDLFTFTSLAACLWLPLQFYLFTNFVSEAKEGLTATVCKYNQLMELNQQSTLPSSGLFVDGILEFAGQGCHDHTDIFKRLSSVFKGTFILRVYHTFLNFIWVIMRKNILERDKFSQIPLYLCRKNPQITFKENLS